jgi:hypothetical protein
MKKEKLNLQSIKNVLSREELKKIMAGSGMCAGIGGICNINAGMTCCDWTFCNNNGICQPCFGEC